MVVIAGLYFAREVLIPVTLAILLSFVLSPVVALLRRGRIPRAPAVLVSVLFALGLLGGRASLDWGGGLIWYAGPGGADAVRRAAASGHATLVRGGAADGPVFQPQAPAVAGLAAAMRRTFDPAGILNPGKLGS